MSTVLVTGGAGYIGSVLVRRLLEAGYGVRVLDELLFGIGPLKELLPNKNFTLIDGSISEERDVSESLKGTDSVIHLAAIVGDPACASNEELAFKTNFSSTISLAEKCKELKIEKFVFASTCSVYGASDNSVLDENSKLNPVSLYAQTRLYGEKGIMALSNGSFKPVVLRFGTVYGLSPRMRFDLVINLLTLKACNEKKISIFGGNQWRPFVHVRDVAESLKAALESPINVSGGRIFNVGSTSENYRLSQLGEIIEGIVPSVDAHYINEIQDMRSYNVSCDRIRDELGFSPKFSVKDGVKEIYDAVRSGEFSDYADRKYYNHK